MRAKVSPKAVSYKEWPELSDTAKLGSLRLSSGRAKRKFQMRHHRIVMYRYAWFTRNVVEVLRDVIGLLVNGKKQEISGMWYNSWIYNCPKQVDLPINQ